MFNVIKKWYQQRQMRMLLQNPRDKRIENWENIKTIGLIFIVGSAERWDLIHRFISAQEKNGKKIFIIGLHPSNYKIDYIFTHTETTICQQKEDFNFWGIPKAGLIDHFASHHFDLLIDSTEQPCFFGKYITASTEADLKVGYNNSEVDDEGEMEMYDLTIQGNQKMDFQDYLEQIVKYLTMVRKNSTTQQINKQ